MTKGRYSVWVRRRSKRLRAGASPNRQADRTLLLAPPIVGLAVTALAIRLLQSGLDDPAQAEQNRAGVVVLGVTGVVATIALSFSARQARLSRQAEHRARELSDELKRSNSALSRTSGRLKRALAAGRVGLWELDPATGRNWFSSEMYELLRLDPDLDHRDLRRRLQLGDPDLAKPGCVIERRFRVRRGDGSFIWVLSRSVLEHREGRADRVDGSLVDITADHEREETLEQLNTELARSNQSLQEFTRIASHDLRSPMRAIRSLIGFLHDDVQAPLDPITESYLERIEQRAERADQLIVDLLTYARAGDRRERPSMADLRSIVTEVLETVERPSGAVVSLDIGVRSAWVEATPLTTCLRNLVDNAFKHLGAPTGRVEISVYLRNDLLVLAVKDDGPGIPDEYKSQMFEPFRPLRARDGAGGSGVGLSVIKRIAEAHDATIEVDSELGHGSTFTLRWPITVDLSQGLLASPTNALSHLRPPSRGRSGHGGQLQLGAP